ncbi:phage tail family protein [Metabacillus halosaccharovorans]|uniref:Phage tail family protein n=1 Tax=Metabacillus halosaccharovorans TaxID=930124 RepID=A0ABT3DI84_9BACI|nr:phage tail family protein [Metabacillus halosaccharovorans]MCV9886236.1 phage tail family protein [Metabacillus halosaccharovorans]
MEKSIFNFKIQYQDGSIIDLHKDKELWVSSFRILSPSPNHITEQIEGQHGSRYLGTTLKDRKITSSISIEAIDPVDFDLFRDELFQIFNPLNKFYIIRDLQPGKRMLVSVANEFDIDYLTLEDGEFDIEFVIHSVFLESVGTTLDELSYEANVWQFGQGLLAEDVSYIHHSTTFQIYNAGNVEIDPRFVSFVITFSGASNNLQIINTTSGDIWKHFGITESGDVITLDRVKAFKNGESIFKDTNFKAIKLKPGWNLFEIKGALSNFEIKFNSRFYYL